MRIDRRISLLFIDLWRRYGFEAVLAMAVAAAVGAIAATLTGAQRAAAFGLSLFIIVPAVCLIAFWAALGEERFFRRASRSALRLLGLYFCVVLPASDSYQAQRANLDIAVAQGMAMMFLGALIPASLVRLGGWRLRRSSGNPERRCSGDERSHQFQLHDMFRVITLLCFVLALATATQRAYGTLPEEFFYSNRWSVGPLSIFAAVIVSSVAALSIFCFWFGDYGHGRAGTILNHFAVWMSITALTIAAGSALGLALRPSFEWLLLGMWVILFLPMTLASHAARWRGWRLVRHHPVPSAKRME